MLVDAASVHHLNICCTNKYGFMLLLNFSQTFGKSEPVVHSCKICSKINFTVRKDSAVVSAKSTLSFKHDYANFLFCTFGWELPTSPPREMSPPWHTCAFVIAWWWLSSGLPNIHIFYIHSWLWATDDKALIYSNTCPQAMNFHAVC